MSAKIIIDTGPMVAFLNYKDHFHNWAVQQFKKCFPPFFTCEAVISEACFLLKNQNGQANKLTELVSAGLIQIPFALKDEVFSINKLMIKYKDVPISLADACLIRLSEQFPNAQVLTLDNDFSIYRRNGRQTIPRISPV